MVKKTVYDVFNFLHQILNLAIIKNVKHEHFYIEMEVFL